MKIEPGRNVGPSSAAPKATKAAAPGFAPASEAPSRAAAASPTGAVTPLDVILALQGGESPLQRRARQARRGHEALDALEELEEALLLGRAPGALRDQLEALQRHAGPSGDERLDTVLLEIDIRLAVEAAKLDRISGKL
ncbi:MAG: flagellar assembly protein FliX [Caulobacteraceae bacterium]